MNGMQQYCNGSGNDRLHERIEKLERELAMAHELLKMQHELVTKLQEEACQRQTT